MFFVTQRYHGIVDKGILTNRIYINSSDRIENKSQLRKEFIKLGRIGAGFSTYDGILGKIIGYILSLFQKAVQIKIGGEISYVNTKSFVHHILRRRLYSADPEKMHLDYLKRKNGLAYDLEAERRVNAFFLKNVQGKKPKDIWDLIKACLKAAEQVSIKKTGSKPCLVTHQTCCVRKRSSKPEKILPQAPQDAPLLGAAPEVHHDKEREKEKLEQTSEPTSSASFRSPATPSSAASVSSAIVSAIPSSSSIPSDGSRSTETLSVKVNTAQQTETKAPEELKSAAESNKSKRNSIKVIDSGKQENLSKNVILQNETTIVEVDEIKSQKDFFEKLLLTVYPSVPNIDNAESSSSSKDDSLENEPEMDNSELEDLNQALSCLENFDESSQSSSDHAPSNSGSSSGTASESDNDYSTVDYSSESDGEEIDIEDMMEKDVFAEMCKNAQLALAKHKQEAKLKTTEEVLIQGNAWDETNPDRNELLMLDIENVKRTVRSSLVSPSLKFRYSEYAAQGNRKSMEDQHFYVESPEKGVFFGVLDGHNGADVANYASKILEGEFFNVLDRKKGNVHDAFVYLTKKIQEKICSKEANFANQGSSAVFCYIKDKLIYTATLGDSEAKIYYQDEKDNANVIPLSCVSNWASEEDKQRAIKTHPNLENAWKEVKDPKQMRVLGSNASRAFGDKISKAVSQDPIISVTPACEGHCIVVACDGYWDFVNEYQSSLLVKNYFDGKVQESLPQYLVNYALNEGKSDDNVTIIAVEIV